MILQALVDYYEALAEKGEISPPGWANIKVSYALEIDENGKLLQVLPLKTEKIVGNKSKLQPREMKLPAPQKRSVNIASNFMCDNSAYLLGFDGKDKPERAVKCFEDAKKLHVSLLSGLEDDFAKAVCSYFENWDTKTALENPKFSKYIEDIKKGANIVFIFNGRFPAESKAISKSWQTHYDGDGDSEKKEELMMRCLVTAEKTIPTFIHPAIKGVQGAQPSGAALVSFNAPAFCSYDREQNINAPISKYASFAYTTALNQLISDKSHVKRIGDMTLVYWSENAEPHYQDAFSKFLDGSDSESVVSDEDLDYYMSAIAKGNTINWDGVPIKPDNRFYILALSPNAARLSIRFFLSDGFGEFVLRIKEHYENIRVVSDGRSKWRNIPLWALLRETVNEKSNDKSSSPQMTGDTLRAILTGCRYPATLYQKVQLRIKAERNVTRGRAAIIKAYLIRNTTKNEYKEAAKVELNENTTYQPYILGRLFSVLEAIQERASGVTTIKDRFFTSACATPAVVFPRIISLADKHLKKLEGGLRVYYEKQLNELMACIAEAYPMHHNLYDQGVFQLGYYHQTQKRYEKKDKSDKQLEIKEN